MLKGGIIVTDDDYERKWRKEIKDHIRKTSRVIATVKHSYVLRDSDGERKEITVNLYDAVRFNLLAWPVRLPGSFSDDQYVHYAEYVNEDTDRLGDGFIIHGLDQFMGLHAASAIYSFLERLESECVLYNDGRKGSRRLFNETYNE